MKPSPFHIVQLYTRLINTHTQKSRPSSSLSMHPHGRRRGRRRRTGSHLRDTTPHPGQQAFHRLPVPDHSSILSHTYCLGPNTDFKDPSRHFCSYAPNHRHHGKPTHTHTHTAQQEGKKLDSGLFIAATPEKSHPGTPATQAAERTGLIVLRHSPCPDTPARLRDIAHHCYAGGSIF